MNKTPAKASDPNDLERHILDPNIAKSEAEWWAKDRIEELEAQVFSKQGAIDMLNNMNNELLADNERLREALETISALGILHIVNGSPHWVFPLTVKGRVDTALTATPAQSLDALLDPYKAHIERLREALEKISDWAKAYPLSVFPEPDFKRANEVLKAAGMTLDAISASNMRHVIVQVQGIVDSALAKERKVP